MIFFPAKSLSYLLLTCAVVFGVYVFLMVGALYFASSATELSALARAKEADVVTLEAKYYAEMSELAKTNPATEGYMTPSVVVYVEASGAPAFSRADR